jgi:hypothetical protein
LLCFVTAGAGVVAEADADAWLKEAQEANERWERTTAELLAENARLREELAPRDTEIEQMAAEHGDIEAAAVRAVVGASAPDAAGGNGEQAGGGKGGGITRICSFRGRGGRFAGGQGACGRAVIRAQAVAMASAQG